MGTQKINQSEAAACTLFLRLLSAELPPKSLDLVLLFGSRVHGVESRRSNDLDIGVFVSCNLRSALKGVRHAIKHFVESGTARKVNLAHSPLIVANQCPLVCEPIALRACIARHRVLFARSGVKNDVLSSLERAIERAEAVDYARITLRAHLADLVAHYCEAPLVDDDSPERVPWRARNWSKKCGRLICVCLRLYLYIKEGKLRASNRDVLEHSARRLGVSLPRPYELQDLLREGTETSNLICSLIEICFLELPVGAMWRNPMQSALPAGFTKLNLGAGERERHLPPPWLNLDSWGVTEPQRFDATDLPTSWNGCFNEVRASHLLEHLPLSVVPQTLQRWSELLAPGGRMLVVVPDGDKVGNALRIGRDGKGKKALSLTNVTSTLEQIYGFGYAVPGQPHGCQHRALYTRELLGKALRMFANLRDVAEYPKENDPAFVARIRDFSQNGFSLRMCGRTAFS